jgi:putative transcriptional regulator
MRNKDSTTRVINRCKYYRTRSKYTQRNIAVKANITINTYCDIETGKREPSLVVAFRIAKALNETIERVFIEVPIDELNSAKYKNTNAEFIK